MKTKSRTKTVTVVTGIAAATAAAALGFGFFMVPGLTIEGIYEEPRRVIAGSDDVTVLQFSMEARTNSMEIQDIGIELFAHSEGAFVSIDGDTDPRELVEECTLARTSAGVIYAGPLAPDVDGYIRFTDNFTVETTDPVQLSLNCDLLEAEITGDEFALAGRMTDVSEIVYENRELGEVVDGARTRLGRFGGGVNADGKEFSVVIVQTGQLTLALSSTSPDGSEMTPGEMEVFRFDATAGSSSDIVIESLVFAFSATDNASSGWVNCESFDTTTLGWYLASSGSPLGGTWSIYDSSGITCADGEAVRYLQVDDPTSSSAWIPPGTTYSYSLYMDTSEASADEDDMIEITIPQPISDSSLSKKSVVWTTFEESGENEYGSVLVEGLPVVGSTISF